MDTIILFLQDAPMKFQTAVDSFFTLIAPHLRKLVWSYLMEYIDNKLFDALVDANMISSYTGKLLVDLCGDLKTMCIALQVSVPVKCEQIGLLLLMNKFALSPALAAAVCPNLSHALIVKLLKSYKPDKFDPNGIPPNVLQKFEELPVKEEEVHAHFDEGKEFNLHITEDIETANLAIDQQTLESYLL